MLTGCFSIALAFSNSTSPNCGGANAEGYSTDAQAWAGGEHRANVQNASAWLQLVAEELQRDGVHVGRRDGEAPASIVKACRVCRNRSLRGAIEQWYVLQ